MISNLSFSIETENQNIISKIKIQKNFLDIKKIDPKQLDPIVLAFLGDSIFELLIREFAIYKFPNSDVSKLNDFKVNIVSCKSQSILLDKILNFLSDDEISIYKKGRNAKIKNSSHSSLKIEYHRATGLEALFGYLYLTNNIERIKELIYKLILT